MQTNCCLILILFLVFFLSLSAFSADIVSLNPGEKLIYRLKLFNFPIGHQEFKIEKSVQLKGHFVYPLSSQIKTSEFISKFFRLDDKMESWVEVNSFFPRWVKIDFHEARDYRNFEIEINPEQGKVIIEDRIKEKTWERELDKYAPLRPLDLLSLIYWLRTQPLKVGKTIPVLLLDCNTLEKIEIEIAKKAKIETPAGTFEAFLCCYQGKTDIKVWFSADEAHLPVQMWVKTTVGTLIASLVDVVWDSSE